MSDPVQWVLDAAGAADQPRAMQDFVEIVDGCHPQLSEDFSLERQSYQCQLPTWGEIRFSLLEAPGAATLDFDTELAVHAVLERPRVQHACDFCTSEYPQHAPFRCVTCQHSICDSHAWILDGRLDAYCPNCVPKADSGEPLAFWCMGPNCREKSQDKQGKRKRRSRRRAGHSQSRPHPESERHHHPKFKDVAYYCKACHDYLFRECEHEPCRKLGNFYCEYVNGDGTTCDRRMCSSHRHRWQVYGPQADGLCLCPEHRKITEMDPAAVFTQLALGTVCRNRRVRKLDRAWGHSYPDSFHRLPTLHTIQYIFINTHKRHADLQLLRDSFEHLASSQSLPREVSKELSANIGNRVDAWAREIQRDDRERSEGAPVFQQVKNAFGTSRNFGEHADKLQLSAFKARGGRPRLFVYFDDPKLHRDLRKDYMLRRRVGMQLGVFVKAEKDRLTKIFDPPAPSKESGRVAKGIDKLKNLNPTRWFGGRRQSAADAAEDEMTEEDDLQ